VGSDPIVCTAVDQCHDAGVCDPATGACSNPLKADGSACEDGDLCTALETCQAGACVGGSAVTCTPLDDCHDAGVCNPATGACSNPDKADGTACDDASACTQNDACQSGVCVGSPAVVCTALDQCHGAGVCDPATGTCSNPPAADGTPCDDADLCTQTDTCQAGACVGSDPIACTAQGQCRDAGVCDPATGACSNPPAADGTACDDGDLCTQADTCAAGACTGGAPTVCTAQGQCRDAGVCDPATGACSNPPAADGTACDDGDLCTQADACVDGACTSGAPVTCTAIDECHFAGVCDPATGQCSSPARPDRIVLSINASADTYTDDEQPLVNFDVVDEDRLGVDGDPLRRIFLRFDVAGIDGFTVESAVVQLRADSGSSSGTDMGGTIHAVSDTTWDESVVTHANSPVVDGPALASLGAVAPNQVVQLDVTPAIGGDGAYAFAIMPGSGNAAFYRSREDIGGPQLVLQLSIPCDDGDACTGFDQCQAGACVGSDPVVCTALDQCHDVGVCDPATGVCAQPAKADGTACDDGALCTAGDACMAGVCQTGGPVVCEPADDCHEAGVCDPATGLCSSGAVKPDGASCEDGNLCTQSGTCDGGACIGSDPVSCAARDQCHEAGVCDPATGLCSDPARSDGTPCDDGSLCTRSDACMGGMCVGADPIVCTALDSCHAVGACDPATGVCSSPAKANGAACDDGNGCTQTDACQAGVCVGGNPKVCTARDACHQAGTCNPATGACSDPVKADGSACDDGKFCTESDACRAGICTGTARDCGGAAGGCQAPACNETADACVTAARADGTACDDGNACTRADSCRAGACVGGDPVVCGALDACHAAGVCDPATGACSNPTRADGTACDDADACSTADACMAGACVGEPLPDTDGDGFCDAVDVCPLIGDGAQADGDGDGTGDLCQCTASAPGRCIAGGGSKRTDCVMEIMPTGPAPLNRKGTKVKAKVRCIDGDPACDLDGAADGTCTFGVSLCFGNGDPRLPSCVTDTVGSVEVLRPSAAKGDENAARLEQALGALGLEVRRRGAVIAEQQTPLGGDLCGPVVRLTVPAPTGSRRAVQKRFQIAATSTGGRRDKDAFALSCE
jgi:hypothetical protein